MGWCLFDPLMKGSVGSADNEHDMPAGTVAIEVRRDMLLLAKGHQFVI